MAKKKAKPENPTDKIADLPSMDAMEFFRLLKRINDTAVISCDNPPVCGIVEFCDSCKLSEEIAEVVKQKYRKEYAAISWCVDDVVHEAEGLGIKCTRAAAAKLLEEEEDAISRSAVETGRRLIVDAIQEITE